jgi:hypothetical protein
MELLAVTGVPNTEAVDDAVAGVPNTDPADDAVTGAPKTELVDEAVAPPKTELLLLGLTGVPKAVVVDGADVGVGAEPPKIEPPLVPLVDPPPKIEVDVGAAAAVVETGVVLPPNMEPPEDVPPPKMELPAGAVAVVVVPPKTEVEPVAAGIAAVDTDVATGVMDKAPPNMDPPLEDAEPPKIELEVVAGAVVAGEATPPKIELEVVAGAVVAVEATPPKIELDVVAGAVVEAPKIDFVAGGCSGFFNESVGVPKTDGVVVEVVIVGLEVVACTGEDSLESRAPKMVPPPTADDDPKNEDVFGAPAVDG